MTLSAAQELLAHETRVTFGTAPRHLDGDGLEPSQLQLLGDELLLRGRGELFIHYRKGHGIVVDQGPGVEEDEIASWLNGSVYSGVASLNGFLPLHASAIAHDGKVHAFTGASGAGKSTLATGLGRFGFPLFCDDTLLIDLSNPDQVMCLPGHKRLKLTQTAVELTGATPCARVASFIDKVYARPLAGIVNEPMPLAELAFLEFGGSRTAARLSAGESIMRLEDGHQTAQIFQSAAQIDRARYFAARTRIAASARMTRLVRLADPDEFDANLAFVAAHITAREGSPA